ncbi:MAG: NAD(P)H-hydrate dehydratase [Acetobacteraceae bacterium]|nr:NAD(P)H-hydrate dehydratase [Acetobacteraceae bacterium]
MAAADRAAIAGGVAGFTLMRAAGRAVAREVLRRFRPCPVAVLCGPGNNGGDGFVVAVYLAERGWPVRVALLGGREALSGDAAAAAALWKGPVLPLSPAALQGAGLVIDALFGAGLTRPVTGVAAETLAAARALPIVAVDLPSGVSGLTGEVLGTAPQAVLTVTFFRLKPGHLLLPGRLLCGETVVADIGIPAAVLGAVSPRAFRNDPALWAGRLPPRAAGDSKYSRGHLTILGGTVMTGAARLAAASARRVGAGLVSIAAGDAASAAVYRAAEPGVIVTEARLDALLADRRRNAWLVGPGLGQGERTDAALASIIGAGVAAVVDADAITACAGVPGRLRGAALLTPHAGEFARVFGTVGADKPAAARRAAAETGAVVLLKGADTVIASPDGEVIIDAGAPPDLATAGTGDVLAGAAAGLIAQGLPAFVAAAAAAWALGAAARRAGHGLIAEDLPPLMPAAFAALQCRERKG